MGAYECPQVQERAKELGIKLTLMPGRLENDESLKDGMQDGIFVQMFGKPGKEAPGMSMDISPIFYVDQKQPAYLLMHGDSDQTVTPQLSYNYYDIVLNFFKKKLVFVNKQG